jgi:hypothetical protein
MGEVLENGVGNGLKKTSGSDLFLTRKGAKVKEARREFGEKSGNFPRPDCGSPESKKTSVPNFKPFPLQTLYLNTDFHGFNGLKGFFLERLPPFP